MKRYEFKFAVAGDGKSRQSVEAALTELGSQGWRIVNATPMFGSQHWEVMLEREVAK